MNLIWAGTKIPHETRIIKSLGELQAVNGHSQASLSLHGLHIAWKRGVLLGMAQGNAQFIAGRALECRL